MPWEKQFDRAHALERALRVFWKAGYEKSSMTVLLRGMGVQKGSFYATFGSKHKVLVEALHLYIKQRFDSFLALSAGRPPLGALRRHLDEVARESTGPDRVMGCFLVNCATELVVVGTPVGLNCACTHATGALPNGTLNLFQDVLPSLLVGIVQAAAIAVTCPVAAATAE